MDENVIRIHAIILAFFDDGPKSESDISEAFQQIPDDIIYQILLQITNVGLLIQKDGIFGLTPKGRAFLTAGKRYKALIEEHNTIMKPPEAWINKIMNGDSGVFE
jgi:predicted transcriptional regulator